jgi:hypothetical protein
MLDSVTAWIMAALLAWGTWRARCRRNGRHRSRFGENVWQTIRAVQLRDEHLWAVRMGVRLPSYLPIGEWR